MRLRNLQDFPCALPFVQDFQRRNLTLAGATLRRPCLDQGRLNKNKPPMRQRQKDFVQPAGSWNCFPSKHGWAKDKSFFNLFMLPSNQLPYLSRCTSNYVVDCILLSFNLLALHASDTCCRFGLGLKKQWSHLDSQCAII